MTYAVRSKTWILNTLVTIPVPTLQQLETLLKEQQGRIQEALIHRLQEKIVPPYTTSAGMILEMPEQFLSFNLYHEGMNLNVIKLMFRYCNGLYSCIGFLEIKKMVLFFKNKFAEEK